MAPAPPHHSHIYFPAHSAALSFGLHSQLQPLAKIVKLEIEAGPGMVTELLRHFFLSEDLMLCVHRHFG